MSQTQKSATLIFFINGINGLMVWTSVLAAFDFFADSFTSYNVYSFMPVALYVGYITVGALYHYLSNNFKYISLIILGNLIVAVTIIGILINSFYFDQSLVGFILLLICSCALGIGTNLSQLTFCSMINYLSQEIVSMYTVGTAVSAVLLTATRMIITAIYGADSTSRMPIIIYFGIAWLFNIHNIYVNCVFCKSQIYKDKIEPYLVYNDRQKQKKNVLTKEKSQKDELFDQQSYKEKQVSIVGEDYMKEEARIQSQSYYKTLYETSVIIFPYPHFILFSFQLFFTMFPGPMLARTYPSLGNTWSNLVLNMSMGLGNALGKYSAGLQNTFNRKSLVYLFFSVIYFFFPVTFIALNADKDDPLTYNDYFPFFVIFLFSYIQGFISNASFIMAFRTCPLLYKKYAGILCTLWLELGIMLGTITEIPYSYALGIN